MAVSDKKKASNKKWNEKNIRNRTISFRVEEYEALEQYCQILGLSVNSFCRQIIMKAINYQKNTDSEE